MTNQWCRLIRKLMTATQYSCTAAHCIDRLLSSRSLVRLVFDQYSQLSPLDALPTTERLALTAPKGSTTAIAAMLNHWAG